MQHSAGPTAVPDLQNMGAYNPIIHSLMFDLIKCYVPSVGAKPKPFLMFNFVKDIYLCWMAVTEE